MQAPALSKKNKICTVNDKSAVKDNLYKALRNYRKVLMLDRILWDCFFFTETF